MSASDQAEADRWNDPETHDGGPDAGFPADVDGETDFMEAVEEGLLGDASSRRLVEALTGRELPLLADELPVGVSWRRGRKHKPMPHEGADAYRKWSRVTLREGGRVVLRDANPTGALAWARMRRRQLEREASAAAARWDEHVERAISAARGEGAA